jgi:hypothetical protein
MKNAVLPIETLIEYRSGYPQTSESLERKMIIEGLIDACDEFCSHIKRKSTVEIYYRYSLLSQENQLFSEKLKSLVNILETRIALTETLQNIAYDVLEKICEQDLKTPQNMLSKFTDQDIDRLYGFFGYTKRHSLLSSFLKKKMHIENFLFVERKKSIHLYKKIIDDYRRESFDIEDIDDDIQFSAVQLLRTKVGRCYEFSSLAFVYLMLLSQQSNKEYQVRFFKGIKPFDHAFLVLMPVEYQEELTYLTQIPADAVILDPWIRCCFTADKMAVYWGDLIRRYGWSDIANDVNSDDSYVDDTLIKYTTHPLIQDLKIKAIHVKTIVQTSSQIDCRSLDLI